MKDNKLIAEFMGISIDREFAYIKDEGSPLEETMPINQMEYHTSWDWLMPVVGKMNKTELWEEYSIGDLSIALVSYDMDYAYGLIVEFIKTHNENK